MTEIGTRNKLFNLVEAKQLLPLLQSITLEYREALEPIQDRLNRMLSNDPRRNVIEVEYEQVVSEWKSKVEQLGLQVKGLWIAEFDVGDGFISWKFPERGVFYFRGNKQDFSERQKLVEYIKNHDPDWARP